MLNILPLTTYTQNEFPSLRDYLQYDGITKAILDFFDVKVKNGNTPNFELHYKYSDGRVKICRPNSTEKWTSTKSEQPTSEYCVFGLEQLPENGYLLVVAAGEKDTLSLTSIGIPAISFNSETSNADQTLMASLKKRFKNIVFLYDADDTGFEQANKLSRALNLAYGILPRGEYGKDLTDFLASGKTKEDVSRIIEKGISKLYRARQYYHLGLLDEMRFSDDEYIIPGIFPYDSLCALVGGSDTGKSLFALQFAISYVVKNDFLGMTVNGGKKVLYVALEDSKNSIRRRVEKLSSELNTKEIARIKKSIFFNHTKESICENIEQHLASHPETGLVIVDTFAELAAGKDMNNAGDVRGILRPFHELSLKHEIAIIFTHHIGKSSEKDGGFSKLRIVGSQAFEASMRAVIEMKKCSNGYHSIAIVKGNDIREDFKSSKTKLTLSLNTDHLWFDRISNISINGTEYSENSRVNWPEIFDKQPELKTSDLSPRVAKALQVSEKTAQNIIAKQLGSYRIITGVYKSPAYPSAEEIGNFQL